MDKYDIIFIYFAITALTVMGVASLYFSHNKSSDAQIISISNDCMEIKLNDETKTYCLKR